MMKEIGNGIGVFMGVDEDSNKSVMKSMAYILIAMDLVCGLPKSVEMVADSWRYAQIPDYVRVHFCCSYCGT